MWIATKKHYKIIDIGCGNGIIGNSANLIINHGFHALLIDGDEESLERGKAFYSKLGLIYNNYPQFIKAFLTKENVNSIISNSLQEDEVDILSIDIDSVHLLNDIEFGSDVEVVNFHQLVENIT